MKRKLISTEEAVDAKGQHAAPCSDCPFARDALPGWLGGDSVEHWLKVAHGDHPEPCHALKGAQCAGLAIFRANVCKLPRDKKAIRLKADRVKVFSTNQEFREHHESKQRASA